MTEHYADDRVILYQGDCREVLATMDDECIDAVVCDPPYELKFMAKGWDGTGVAFDPATWKECLRVLKPGGHLLAFGGSRTWHRLVVAIEDAGFEIRDSIAWLYGSGFPKSMDVSKAIDKRPGVTQHAEFVAHLVERRTAAGLSCADVSERIVGTRSGACWNWEHHQFPESKWWPSLRDLLNMDAKWDAIILEANRVVVGRSRHASGIGNGSKDHYTVGGTEAQHYDITAPATDAAKQWEGWGTALKPAFEPIVVARKPLGRETKTVAANVLAHGTGALNIDACRVSMSQADADFIRKTARPNSAGQPHTGDVMNRPTAPTVNVHDGGRWPTNVVLDGDMADALDEQSGIRPGGAFPGRQNTQPGGANGTMNGGWTGSVGPARKMGDSGGASRFFPVFRYQAKAPAKERPKVDGVAHPTVKPLELMRWLIRLVTPPEGIVLDPFAGSGATLEAAMIEGILAIGVELDPTHLPLIMQRIERQG